MYIYYISSKNGLEKIISPFLISKGLIDEKFIDIKNYVSKFDIELPKCKYYRIILDINNNVLYCSEHREGIYSENDNEFIIYQDYRSFIVYTKNDRYEYCSYCDLIANKVLDNCHICCRKKCGSCDDFEKICNYCDTNIII